MAKIFEVRLERATPPVSGRSDRTLEVVVLFTTPAATLLALQSAAKLSDGLSAQIRLVVPWVVPYPLALEEPPVKPSVISRKLCEMAHQAGVDCSIEISLCRDRWQAIKQAIPEHSLVMIGAKPRWWEFGKQKLNQQLREEGHQIAYAEGRCS